MKFSSQIKRCFKVSLPKMAKLKLYCSVIRPVVTYACETWTLKETITNRLMVFERNVLRKIYADDFYTKCYTYFVFKNSYWQVPHNTDV